MPDKQKPSRPNVDSVCEAHTCHNSDVRVMASHITHYFSFLFWLTTEKNIRALYCCSRILNAMIGLDRRIQTIGPTNRKIMTVYPQNVCGIWYVRKCQITALQDFKAIPVYLFFLANLHRYRITELYNAFEQTFGVWRSLLIYACDIFSHQVICTA